MLEKDTERKRQPMSTEVCNGVGTQFKNASNVAALTATDNRTWASLHRLIRLSQSCAVEASMHSGLRSSLPPLEFVQIFELEVF